MRGVNFRLMSSMTFSFSCKSDSDEICVYIIKVEVIFMKIRTEQNRTLLGWRPTYLISNNVGWTREKMIRFSNQNQEEEEEEEDVWDIGCMQFLYMLQ